MPWTAPSPASQDKAREGRGFCVSTVSSNGGPSVTCLVCPPRFCPLPPDSCCWPPTPCSLPHSPGPFGIPLFQTQHSLSWTALQVLSVLIGMALIECMSAGRQMPRCKFCPHIPRGRAMQEQLCVSVVWECGRHLGGKQSRHRAGMREACRLQCGGDT